MITFDDGYADNLHNAKPLLEHYDIPATVFVVSGYVGHEREFWWDELERLLLQPRTLPESLCLYINGSPSQWQLGESAEIERLTISPITHGIYPSPAYASACTLLCTLEVAASFAEDERRKVLDQLLTWAGTEPLGRSTHRPLSRAELLSSRSGGIDRNRLAYRNASVSLHPFRGFAARGNPAQQSLPGEDTRASGAEFRLSSWRLQDGYRGHSSRSRICLRLLH